MDRSQLNALLADETTIREDAHRALQNEQDARTAMKKPKLAGAAINAFLADYQANAKTQLHPNGIKPGAAAPPAAGAASLLGNAAPIGPLADVGASEASALLAAQTSNPAPVFTPVPPLNPSGFASSLPGN